MDSNSNNVNFIGDYHGSLRDQQTGLEPDSSGTDNVHVSGCTPQLEFDTTATCITTNGRIAISEGLQAASGKGKSQQKWL